MARKLEGGCFCGAVRYRLLDAPMIVHCCHCRQCQNQTGSAFVVNAMLETEKVKLLRGELEVTAMSEPGERPHDIHRCRNCKVAVWSDYGHRPFRFVRVGTLDRPAALPPDAHIFTRSKQPWVRLPRGARAFEVFYERPKIWSKRSLARLEAALAKAR